MENTKSLHSLLEGIPDDRARDLSNQICKLLVNTGLSFRQAESLLEYTKDRLKDAKISN